MLREKPGDIHKPRPRPWWLTAIIIGDHKLPRRHPHAGAPVDIFLVLGTRVSRSAQSFAGILGRRKYLRDNHLMLSFLFLCFLPSLVHAQGAELLRLYAPTTNSLCPNVTQDPLLREFTVETQALHPRESAYITTRESTVIQKAWGDWLGTGSQIGYDLSVLSKNLTRVGIAFSGGGFRAAQYSAGVTSALDARDQSAKSAGTGGLLQVASYMSGLSGELYCHRCLSEYNLKGCLSQVVPGLPAPFISTTSPRYPTLCMAMAKIAMDGFWTWTSSSQGVLMYSTTKTLSSSKAFSLASLQRHPPECASSVISPL